MSGFFRNFASSEIHFASRSYGKNQICDNTASANLLIINALCIKILLNFFVVVTPLQYPPITVYLHLSHRIAETPPANQNPHCAFHFV